jgi:DNA invertase Pin-like site-specific DNA recombinase
MAAMMRFRAGNRILPHMRTAIYARISRDPEDQKVGVDRQLVRGREVAEARGWSVVETFTDNDASGFNGDPRPGFDALRDAIHARTVEAVIVQHQDRLARNVSTFRSFADLCAAADVRVETWTGPVDTATATGRFTSTVQAATDEHYSALISEKARAAHAEIAKRGEPNGGRRPFGYQRTINEEGHRTFSPDPDEAPVLVEMFTRFNAGDSIRSIALDLDRRGIKTAGGSRWSTARVREMLGNATYLGVRVHRGVKTEGNWPALVGKADFERAQAVLNARQKPPGHNVRSYYLAGGTAQCGVCGTALVARPQRGKRRYGCPPDIEGSCGGIGIQAVELEAQVGTLIVGVLGDPRIIEAVARYQDTGNTDTLAEIEAVEARRTELAEAFAVGEIDRAQLAAATAKLDGQRDELRSRLTSAPDDLDLDTLRELWESERVDWKARVAATLIESVTINPAVRGRSKYDPDRVEVRWRS